MGRKKKVSNVISLGDYLENKYKSYISYEEDLPTNVVDIQPTLDRNINDGIDVILSLIGVETKIIIPVDMIDVKLSESLKYELRQKDIFVINKGKVTEFLQFVADSLKKNPKILSQIMKNFAIKDPSTFKLVVPMIPDVFNFVVDKKIEFEFGEVIDNGGMKNIQLKYTKERAKYMQELQPTLDNIVKNKGTGVETKQDEPLKQTGQPTKPNNVVPFNKSKKI